MVNATAADGAGDTYIGGSFDTIGPGNADAGSVSLSGGAGKTITEAAGATGGSVLAIAPDGGTGYYIGGTFTAVQGTACTSLADITSSGATCINGIGGNKIVNALDRIASSGVLAVGGNFTDGTSANLVFLDNTGGVHASGGDPNGTVNALTDDGTWFYAGGQFTSLATSPTATTVGNLAKYAVTGSGAAITVAPVKWLASVQNCSPTSFAKTASCIPPTSGAPAAVYSLSMYPLSLLINTTRNCGQL